MVNQGVTGPTRRPASSSPLMYPEITVALAAADGWFQGADLSVKFCLSWPI
jgi:hypothetical protein